MKKTILALVFAGAAISSLVFFPDAERNLHVETKINSPPEKIWQVLMDFERYPEWNPFIKSISGKQAVGEQLHVTVQSPGNSPATFEPVISVLSQNQKLKWKDKLLFKGLFDGEHYFILEKNDDGSTTFIHGENFSGFLVRFFGGRLDRTEEGFELMNKALKAKCEK